MKRPTEITVYPLEAKKDDDGKGLWFYVPSWIVRAYRLNDWGTNMGKVKFIISETSKAMWQRIAEEQSKSIYYKENWSNKLRRERRRKKNEQS